jgi:hypothetical protein
MANVPRILWLLFGLWAIAFCGSFLAFALMEPTGSGFTRGLNRASAFLGWQAAAIGFAMVLWLRARQIRLWPPIGWLMRLPIILALLLLAAFVAFVGWGIMAGRGGAP